MDATQIETPTASPAQQIADLLAALRVAGSLAEGIAIAAHVHPQAHVHDVPRDLFERFAAVAHPVRIHRGVQNGPDEKTYDWMTFVKGQCAVYLYSVYDDHSPAAEPAP